MSGACSRCANRTITHDMNGLCPSRHSARLLYPRPDLRLAHRGELEVADDAGLVDKECAREAEHAETPRGCAVAVEDRLQAIEPERVQEGARLVAWFHEVDLENDHVRLAGGHALQRGHLLAARWAPRRPEVHDDDLAAVGREPEGLAVEADPLEVRSRRSDPAGGAVRFDLRADDARV